MPPDEAATIPLETPTELELRLRRINDFETRIAVV
jgi:hypothetical protein